MGKTKEMSREKKNLICAVEKKIPYKQISEHYDVVKSTISILVKRYRDCKTLENKMVQYRTSRQNFGKTIKTRSPQQCCRIKWHF